MTATDFVAAAWWKKNSRTLRRHRIHTPLKTEGRVNAAVSTRNVLVDVVASANDALVFWMWWLPWMTAMDGIVVPLSTLEQTTAADSFRTHGRRFGSGTRVVTVLRAVFTFDATQSCRGQLPQFHSLLIVLA